MPAEDNAINAEILDELLWMYGTRTVVKTKDAKNIPITAMTANAFEEDVQEALAAGMNAHVSKPIDIQLLWNTLGRIYC